MMADELFTIRKEAVMINLETSPVVSSSDWRKLRDTTEMNVIVPAEIRTENLPNESL
jgi:hypothetical protein